MKLHRRESGRGDTRRHGGAHHAGRDADTADTAGRDGVSPGFLLYVYIRPITSPGHRIRGHRGLVPSAARGETVAEGATAHGTGRSGRSTWNIQVIALKRFVWSFGVTPLDKRGHKMRE